MFISILFYSVRNRQFASIDCTVYIGGTEAQIRSPGAGEGFPCHANETQSRFSGALFFGSMVRGQELQGRWVACGMAHSLGGK